ncbi:hypothetical protein [uncultured Pseudomonas sp.]|uniref:hypothetical protein n=1 Tax=uncultured Pseudomonas sp. TaxID=114707 RepID=UPI00258D9D19|nr:hypothetical protein [uncultured Pseudomonas sp.]
MATIYENLTKIPFAGEILRILNIYAYNGDYEAEYKFAGLGLWLKCYFWNTFISLVAACLCMPQLMNDFLPFNHRFTYLISTSPGTIITGVLPSLLGFGIGVYALIFGLKANFLGKLQKHLDSSKEKPSGSTLILNVNFAVPLLCLTLSIAAGIIQTILPKSTTIELLSWTCLWMSLFYTIETIFAIFNLGEVHIVTEVNEPEIQKSKTRAMTRRPRVNRSSK